MIAIPWFQRISILHPFKKNYKDLHNFVASLCFRSDVICRSKSRTNKPLKSIQLQQSYNFINSKPNRQAGGTAIYVWSELNFSQIDAFGLTGTGSILLKIWNKDSTKALVIIASIYRGTRVRISTNSFVIFRTVWRNYLLKKNFYILSDININETNQLYP